MFKIGDLVRYDSTIWKHSPIGLIVGKHSIFTKIVFVQWSNCGAVEEVNAGHLEEIFSK